jgi:hypothetical protein
MRRFTSLGLLLALLAPCLVESAPAPERRQTYPEVYALLYVSKGSDEKVSSMKWLRILILTRYVHEKNREYNKLLWEDPELRKLAVVQQKDRDELSKWMLRNIHAQTLENTSVIRVWFTDGTPEEQAVIINATLRAVLKEMETRQERWTKQRKSLVKRFQENEDFKQKWERDYEVNVIIPSILEWAAVKGKREAPSRLRQAGEQAATDGPQEPAKGKRRK